ncbi:MAG TPA: hypothetical protein VHB99_11330 [Pirellulales bacterium]|nr:hypothetical protein [Pirellulales bacterium]
MKRLLKPYFCLLAGWLALGGLFFVFMFADGLESAIRNGPLLGGYFRYLALALLQFFIAYVIYCCRTAFENPPRPTCSFCSNEASTAGPLVDGRGRSFVCEGCARRIAEDLNDAADRAALMARCSFSRHRPRRVCRVAIGLMGKTICQECADAALWVLEHGQSHRKQAKG